MAAADLKRVIARVEDLPTLPRTVLRITELVNDPRAAAKDLSIVITDDQVLTARLLKLVNSSFYAFPRRVSTVTQATVLVGCDAIRNLLITTSVLDLFPARSAKVRREQELLWDHSLGCAIGAKAIGTFLRHEKLEELFVAGLLHDIGKLVEMMFLPTEFSRVAEHVRENGGLISEAEQALLGCTHAEIGRLLAERWNLPVKLADIIALHHRPVEAGAFALEASIVHLADILARALDIGYGGDRKVPALDPTAWNLLKLKTPALANQDGRFPVYVIFTTRRGLEAHYGAHSAALVDAELIHLAKAIRGQRINHENWGAILLYADDPEYTSYFDLQPAPHNDPWALKLLLADLDVALGKGGERHIRIASLRTVVTGCDLSEVSLRCPPLPRGGRGG